jgi:hypothetical protein
MTHPPWFLYTGFRNRLTAWSPIVRPCLIPSVPRWDAGSHRRQDDSPTRERRVRILIVVSYSARPWRRSLPGVAPVHLSSANVSTPLTMIER